jgi:hypothetical protein
MEQGNAKTKRQRIYCRHVHCRLFYIYLLINLLYIESRDIQITSEPKPSHLMYNENDFSAVPEERGLRQRTADDGFGPVGGFDSVFGGGVTCSE